MAYSLRLLEDGAARALEASPEPAAAPFDPMEAMAAWWETQPTLKALCSDGNLWFMEIPESVDLPRALVTLERIIPEEWTTGYSLERAIIIMQTQGRTAALAANMMQAIQPVLTMAPLTSNGRSAIHALPDASSYEISQSQGPKGQDCWTASLYFDIFFEGIAPIHSA